MAQLHHWIDDRLRGVGEFFEDLWFDGSRNVQTSRNVSREDAGTGAERFGDSEAYMPARPRHIREALRAIPVEDVSGYSYVDLGSGKGRTLFIAAEFPFRDVTGVELSRRLHEQASENIRGFRFGRRRCGPIYAVHEDAKEFVFPEGPLVVYLFNPFGYASTRAVLENLAESLRRSPRHAVIILLWPKYSELVRAVEGIQLRREKRYYQIFEARPPERSQRSAA